MHHIIPIILFVLSALFILFASHLFVFWSLTQFFKIVNPEVSTILAIIIILLALSFIVASLLAHWRENMFTRAFYFASGIWLGMLTNLVITMFVGWILFGISEFTGLRVNPGIIGALAVAAAIVISAWGIYNAYNPQIKEISVKIKNLPAGWQGKTAVQISDTHLGHVFGQKFLKKIVGQINGFNPEIVFITGDLFDGMDGQLDFHVQPLDELTAPQGVFFINGNHEIYFGIEKAKNILAKTKVRILSDESVDVGGLNIIGLNYAESWDNRDLVKVLVEKVGFIADKPSILLYHSPDQIDEFKEAGINLQLSGHTHRGQLFPFNYITKLIFRGLDYGLHEDGDYTLYTTSGVGSWGPTMRTGNRPEIVVIKFL
jgi:predicted MPP superfamily phosphohydrolase